MNMTRSSTVVWPLRRWRSTACPGFTLIEALVVLAVLAVVLAIAVPGLGQTTQSIRLSTQSNRFLADLHMARSEAIKRNGRVVLCKSGADLDCTSSGDWSQGWLVFHDRNNNTQLDAGEDLIQQSDPMPGDLKLSGNFHVARYLSFGPTGGTKLTSGAFQAGTLTLCRQSSSAVEARHIVINSAGRPRVRQLTVNACL